MFTRICVRLSRAVLSSNRDSMEFRLKKQIYNHYGVNRSVTNYKYISKWIIWKMLITIWFETLIMPCLLCLHFSLISYDNCHYNLNIRVICRPFRNSPTFERSVYINWDPNLPPRNNCFFRNLLFMAAFACVSGRRRPCLTCALKSHDFRLCLYWDKVYFDMLV